MTEVSSRPPLRSDASSKNVAAESNVMVRGLQSRLLSLLEEKNALVDEITELKESNKSLQQVLTWDGDVKEVSRRVAAFAADSTLVLIESRWRLLSRRLVAGRPLSCWLWVAT
jgi:hypothetical protein